MPKQTVLNLPVNQYGPVIKLPFHILPIHGQSYEIDPIPTILTQHFDEFIF